MYESEMAAGARSANIEWTRPLKELPEHFTVSRQSSEGEIAEPVGRDRQKGEGVRIVLVGNGAEEHVGAHFLRATKEFRVACDLMDVREAEKGSVLQTKINWWLRDHRPNRLERFSEAVVAHCRSTRPACLLSTGVAPLTRQCLERLRTLDIKRINFLTDDPWNTAHRARWFLDSLPSYDWVFSPRRSNIADLTRLGCRHVEYLPFAYSSDIHYPVAVPPHERLTIESDVLFAGGADADRACFVSALIRNDISVALYGGYWDRFRDTKHVARGLASPDVIRRAMASTSVALCLVRRANRDGHAMRTFEAPAMRACLIVEDTEEHRSIFGADGDAVVYFRSCADLVSKTRWLLSNTEIRQRLAAEAYRLITQGQNRYEDRLATIFSMTGLLQGRS